MPARTPLKSLPAFDAAMRHGSFSMAADELSVTPGAIGQQIQKLESWLGTALFVRTVRKVEPTAQAHQYWAAIQPALARIEQAGHTLRTHQASEVWLSMPPTLAAKWFAPRMADFLRQHPHIALHLGTTSTMVDMLRDPVDLAVRRFDGQDPALECTLLCPDHAHLYCAPQYAERLQLATPGNLAHVTLLKDMLHPHWNTWLQRFAGLTPQQIAAIPSQHFDQTLMAIEAARHGQGVVLCSPMMIEAELRDGSLCEPLPARLTLDKAYYVVHPKGRTLRPAVQAFKTWLLSVPTLQPPS